MKAIQKVNVPRSDVPAGVANAIRRNPTGQGFNIYTGLFLISCASLALEITLTRLLSVITWYHLAFFAISIAMLGMTAGSVTVYVKPEWFTVENIYRSAAKFALIGAHVVVFSLIMLLLIPLSFSPNLISQLAFLMATIFCFIPFYFTGTAISGVLTQTGLPIGRLYSSDLVGASLGCLLVLFGLEVFSAPSMIIICGAIFALSAYFFSRAGQAKDTAMISIIACAILLLIAVFNSLSGELLYPLMMKGKLFDTKTVVFDKWNSFSRVVVWQMTSETPQLWSASPLFPQDTKTNQYYMNIDGEAATVIRQNHSTSDLEHLQYDATNFGYFLSQPDEPVAVIGVGGGRDVQSAIYFGHNRIVGIDVNPIFIDLLKGPYREFAGIADHPGVQLVVDEARSYLTNTQEKFGLIQMSLIDTWAATGAGAYSLTENSLYTVEAWKTFTSRLTENGIFSVSRWYNEQNLGETGRVVSLAVETLLQNGVENPAEHIIMMTSGPVSTLIISNEPFSAGQIAKAKEVAARYQYHVEIIPGTVPDNEILRNFVSAKNSAELRAFADHPSLNYLPPTDESPYFFNILKIRSLREALGGTPGIIYGNVMATMTLISLIASLLVMMLGVIIIPLVYKTRMNRSEGKKSSVHWAGAVYFALIGAGFMLLEIALIQRLSVFLSHPIYALGVLLFSIIASSGLGSYLSEKLPLNRKPWCFACPVVLSALILIMRFLLPVILTAFMTSAMLIKVLVAILVIAPMGLLMGMFFPAGMRIVRGVSNADTPWYWALNGIVSVLCSALAVFISIFIGISVNFYLAAALYLAVLVPVYALTQRQSRAEQQEAGTLAGFGAPEESLQ